MNGTVNHAHLNSHRTKRESHGDSMMWSALGVKLAKKNAIKMKIVQRYSVMGINRLTILNFLHDLGCDNACGWVNL